MRTGTIVIISAIVLLGFFFFYQQTLAHEQQDLSQKLRVKNYTQMQNQLFDNKKHLAQEVINTLHKSGCVLFDVDYNNTHCDDHVQCVTKTAVQDLRHSPLCLDYGLGRIETPDSVRGIYMSSYVAGNKKFRNQLLQIAKETEINSIMIDIKEVDGVVNFVVDNEQIPFQRNRMPDIKEYIKQLHEHDVYVIGRIVLFKDKAWAAQYPEQAVQRKDRPGVVWADYGGKKFIDPGAEEFWDYLVELSSAAYDLGFDEINADYIRFPSDGNMKNTHYPFSQKYINEQGGVDGRVYSLGRFMEYYTTKLRERHPNIVISADVFGMVTSLSDDLTIGQKLEPFLEYFDYVMPMVYPSHYPRGFVHLPGHPDNHPYEVIKKSMDDAVRKAQVVDADTDKLRPWLQDFDCTWCKGYFPYGAKELREQIQATYDSGLDSWYLWNAGNRYTTSGLKRK